MIALFFALAAVGFGFVIFIHELGHFLFAKWAGVRVEVFSIGFGPRLLTRKIGETEYSLSLLPLGGYVRMTGQEDMPEDAVDPATVRTAGDPRSYLQASPAWKAAILLGGVLFNFLSSYLILLALAFHGLPVVRPLVGEVMGEITSADGTRKTSPAAEMGLRPGDKIVSINGERIRSFEDLTAGTIIAGAKPVVLTVQRPGIAEPITLPANGTVTPVYDRTSGRPALGIEPAFGTRLEALDPQFDPLIAALTASANAPKAGERITAVAGQPLGDGDFAQALVDRLRPHFGTDVAVTVTSASGASRETSLRFAGQYGGLDSTLGLPVVVAQVTPGQPAAEAGIQAGDAIVSIDGTPVTGTEHVLALIRSALDRDGRLTLVVRRPASGSDVTATGSDVTAVISGREIAGRLRIGLVPALHRSGPLAFLPPAIDGKPSAAAAAGLQPGDALVGFALANQPTDLSATAQVVRGGTVITVPLSAAGLTAAQASTSPGRFARWFGATATPALTQHLSGVLVTALSDAGGSPVGAPVAGLLQVRTATGADRSVDLRALGPDAGALLAGLKTGDWILGVVERGNGADATASSAWEILRGADATIRTVTLHGRLAGQPLQFALETTPYRLDGMGEAFAIANKATHDMIWKSLLFIERFFRPAEQGGLSATKNLQGPIGIFDSLRVQAQHFGLDSWLKLVALIGLNLVLVNLLPIPVTDGGQLLFLAIETATGRPLPNLVRTIAAYIGVALVVGLMLFVTTLDIARRI